MKKALTKGVLRNQILDEGGAEVSNDLLKIIPFFRKRLSNSQIGRVGQSLIEVEIR